MFAVHPVITEVQTQMEAKKKILNLDQFIDP